MARHFPALSPLVALVGDDPVVDVVANILQSANAGLGAARVANLPLSPLNLLRMSPSPSPLRGPAQATAASASSRIPCPS